MTAPEFRNKKQRKQQQKLRTPGKAVAKYVRISPRKVRLVVDVIRGKSVRDAEDLLRFIPRAASEPVAKVLNSAKHNALHNDEMLEDRLVITAAYVDAGPTLKRLIPRARGSANIIKKRTSHITIVVGEKGNK
ncbi:50S ribosomal protein L22 [Deinococcus arenae]|uniref:Large ribosomal subunit protein uL22 n=1 Tax=Deinococcus arenae TaxID=1452751 RepID=A0A8H9GN93_9DEIO|nr:MULTISPECIES: 50S ribosomal protein L22 [Deinococcus]AWT36460.1 50S ribosomal protein L22 [Deinococcus actinosclerus]GGM38980.1 50S ribosomal protein L22 [Deinococcus arenae]